MKKRKHCLLLVSFLFLVVFNCGCGKASEGQDNREPGGYVENIVTLPTATVFMDFVQEETGLRLADISWNDMVSEDGGEHFQVSGDAFAVGRSVEGYQPFGAKAASDGNRIFYTYAGGRQGVG